jgi:segregation and condensation protein A
MGALRPNGYYILNDVYQGPFDLLLDLIKKSELDITRLALAQVTGEYLASIRQMDRATLYQASEFLSVAARLLEIKSSVLAFGSRPDNPRDESAEDAAADQADDLVEALKVYKSYKEAAEWLDERASQDLRSYAAPPRKRPSIPGPEPFDISLKDLTDVAFSLFDRDNEDGFESLPAPRARVSLGQLIHRVLTSLRAARKKPFRDLLPRNPDSSDVVLTLLAVLELVRRRVALAEQPSLFADIDVRLLPAAEADQSPAGSTSDA